ncbi:MAG: Dna2/Cas4 domain-containing protein [Holophagales bacterium]|nr:Dna2/Cas4 domain-containing protein [Holophagales bacterium]MXX61255.1 Dna2/Cas4 domain-containing protein [Holophagales bacterium]MYD22047.1 Dna2/Cas4 domain-containing protein [Holophagales bacterium]MYI32890.1 Dna2/Cas4 domain-containing protein [Holophagales bacterium]
MTDLPPASILVSTSARARLAEAGRRLRECLETGDEVLLLAASRGAADDLLRGLTGTGGGLLGVHAMSFQQWAREAAALDLAARGLRPITPLGTEAIAARAARLAAADGELERLSPVAAMPGFARSLAATLGELRAAGVPAPALMDDDGTRDLGRLLERFTCEMERFALADRSAVLRLAAEAVAKGRAIVPPRSIWLDLSVRSRSQADVLGALAARSREVVATVAAGDDESLEWLTSVFGAEAATNVDQDADGEARTSLGRVQRLVFETGVDAEGTASAEETPPSVDLFSAAGEGQECVEIARRIRRAAAGGLAFDRIAILVRQPTAYLPLVEDALGRARIPTYITRGSLRPNPAGRAFLALLACAGERLSASRFAEYLSLGQTPEPAEDGAPPKVEEVPWVEPAGDQLVLKSPEATNPESTAADAEDAGESEEDATPAGALRAPAQWERLLVDAAVVGHAERWRTRLEGLDAEFRLQLREVEDENEGRRGYLERQIARLGTLRSFALPLVEFLEGLPESADWGVWLDRLGRLATMSLRRPQSVLEVLAELRPLSEVDEVGLAEVERVLAERLRFSWREPPKRRYGRVFVGGVEESAGRSFDLVFVPGLAEGVFPRRSGEDALLLDERRRALGGAGIRLAVDVDRTRREQLLLRLAAGAAGRSLVASYPRVDLVQGRARVPSLYALDLLRAAEGRLPDLDTLGRRAAAAGAAVVGWPAPADPEEAIDEAEFDLAMLQPLLGSGLSAAERRGRARFLLSSNEHLARALRARARRWRKGWFPVDGLVDAGEEARDYLSRHRIGERSYSPTALQNFAACPYRFYLQAVLYLRPRDELVRLEQLDPLTRGGIFHEIQFRLFGALREAELLPVTSARLDDAFRVLDVVVEEAEREYRDELAPPIERVWRAEFEGLRGDLRGWLRQVADEGGGWTPIHAELGFGLARSRDRDPQSVREAAPVLDVARLRGSIDLVEADAAGRLRVTDHKTGGARHAGSSLVIGGGKVLQPVLYSLAAEAVLGRDVVSGRLFYCTQRGGYRDVSVPLDERSRNAAGKMFATVDGALEEGFLPAAPGRDECRYCDYRPVCGPYEDLRVARKQKSRLGALNDLRLEP